MEPYNGKAPFVRGSATSEAAAERVDPRAEWRVHEFLLRCGMDGATDDEIERALKMRHQTASARRRTLVLKCVVVPTNRTRKTSSGRSARVWVALGALPVGQLSFPFDSDSKEGIRP